MSRDATEHHYRVNRKTCNMSAKAILIFCAQALLVKTALTQCITAPYGLASPAFAYDGLAAPFAYDGCVGWAGRGLAYDGIYPAVAPALDFTPTSGGALPVSSGSAIAPVGISVASENVYEGALAVAGELPFVGTVGLEGVLPTAGAGAVNHACGNGISAMASGPAAYAPGYSAATIAPAASVTPPGAIAPAAAIAPGLAAPALGYRAGLVGRGCGCAY